MRTEGSLLAMIALCILAETGRELCFAHGATGRLIDSLRKPIIWLGIAFLAVNMVLWTRVLEQVALSTAVPLMAVSYLSVAFASATLFNGSCNLRHTLGVTLVTLGIACVGAAGL